MVSSPPRNKSYGSIPLSVPDPAAITEPRTSSLSRVLLLGSLVLMGTGALCQSRRLSRAAYAADYSPVYSVTNVAAALTVPQTPSAFMQMMQESGLDPSFNFDLKDKPSDFSPLICDETNEQYVQKRWYDGLYDKAELYETCYKGYLCCSGPQMKCMRGNVYNEVSGVANEDRHCGDCMAEFAPLTLTDEAVASLADGALDRTGTDTENPEQIAALWRQRNYDERVSYGYDCWQALSWCNQVCPRDGKQMSHDFCGDCITNFETYRTMYDLPTGEEVRIQREVETEMEQLAQR